MVLGAIGGVILLIALIVGCFFIGSQLVDIFLILAALISLAAFACLGYAALQIIAVVREVKGEITTLVNTAQETLTEVQGTARFVSDSVVSPVAQAAGWLTAIRSTLKSFTEPLFKRGG